MNLQQLTIDELQKLAISPDKKEKEAFWNQIEKEIDGFEQTGKNNWTMSMSNFLTSDKNEKLFQDRGFARCAGTKLFVRPDKAVKCFTSFANYQAGKATIIGQYAKRDGRLHICYDEILREHFLDNPIEVISDEFKQVKIAQSHFSHKKNEGLYVSSQVSRDRKVYSTFPTNFYGNKKSPKDWVIPEGDTVGIEIEMLFPDVVSKLKFSSWLGKNYQGWHCEYDGSLQDHGNAGDNGLELISPPLLIEDMMKVVEPICNQAVQNGGVGFPAGIFYGMHVTNRVPKPIRGGATKEQIAARYICLVNSPALRSFWQLFARRKGESFMKYCPFKDVELNTCLMTEHAPEQGHQAHRRAVYVRNKTLLETRIFRSSLNTRQVRANIEICHLTMLFCRSNLFSLTDFGKFQKFLEENASDDLSKILYRRKNTPIVELNKAALDYNIEKQPAEDYNQ